MVVDRNGDWTAYLYREGMVRMCALPYTTAAPVSAAAAAIAATAANESAGQEQQRAGPAATQGAEEWREAAISSDWQLAHLSNTSLKGVASASQPPCTELLWDGLLHDIIRAGPTTGTAPAHNSESTNGAKQNDHQAHPVLGKEDDSRVAAFWAELVSIAEVTARALRRGTTTTGDTTYASRSAEATADSSDVAESHAGEATGGCPLIGSTVRCGMFQVLGLDVMLDAAHRPWVLEVNARPALTGTESQMKQRLLRMILRILPRNDPGPTAAARSPSNLPAGDGGGTAPNATAKCGEDSFVQLRCFCESD
eukprot:COSAG02_NODE_1302_length_13358_cov_12.308243_2_plen_310_part_00